MKNRKLLLIGWDGADWSGINPLLDAGKMQMYVNYFDRHVKLDDEQAAIGIILCKKKKDTLVEITLPEDANIHAAKYQTYLPDKKALRKQLEEAQAEWEAHHEK